MAVSRGREFAERNLRVAELGRQQVIDRPPFVFDGDRPRRHGRGHQQDQPQLNPRERGEERRPQFRVGLDRIKLPLGLPPRRKRFQVAQPQRNQQPQPVDNAGDEVPLATTDRQQFESENGAGEHTSKSKKRSGWGRILDASRQGVKHAFVWPPLPRTNQQAMFGPLSPAQSIGDEKKMDRGRGIG